MGNVAMLLKKLGHEVAGSDAGVYPPMSVELEKAGVVVFEGFQEDNMLSWKPQRIVVGNAVSRGNPQVEHILKNRELPFVSLAQLIGEDLIGSRPSVVVAGTHGKTTTTSLTAFALEQLGLSPGYLVGGVPLDLPSGNAVGNGHSPFVIEGDEYDSAFFDKRSKFIHYRPRILVLNNLEFDHGDIFRDLADISRSFSHLLKIVPSDGFVLRNGDDPNLLALPEAPWTNILSVGVGESNDFRINSFHEDLHGSRFELHWLGRRVLSVEWKMPGLFNARNLAMAVLSSVLVQACIQDREMDLKNLFSHADLLDFSACLGVKRRQEILLESDDFLVFSDFGHHPTAIEATLKSMRARWPRRKTIACFEPRSNTAVTNVFQNRFADALGNSDLVLLGAVHRAEKIPENKRIDPLAMIKRIEASGGRGFVFSKNSILADFLESEVKDSNPILIVFFTNGSFDGVMSRVAQTLSRSKA